MRQILIFPVLCFIVLLCQGCGPIYRTHYDYVAPQTQWGRTCVNKCLANKSQCQLSCNQVYQDCVNYANNAAKPDYKNYLKKEKKKNNNSHVGFHKTIESFANYSGCEKECRCDDDYRVCYAQCGGTIITTKTCVFNCSKVKAPS